MEPFVLRCETCHARLRVRDERVIGQIHECPRCHSMVHVVPPAAFAATAETASSGSGESMVFPAVAPPEVEAPPVAAMATATAMPEAAPATDVATRWPTVALWAGGGTALFLLGGIVGAWMLSGEEAPTQQVAAALPVTEPAAASQPQVDRPQPAATPPATPEPEPAVASPSAVSLPTEEPIAAPIEPQQVAQAAAPTPPVAPPPAPSPAPEPKPARTLTLEPVERSASVGELADLLATPVYEAPSPPLEMEAENDDVPWPASGNDEPVTNVGDRLAVQIDAIELPAMPLASFVELFSEMAAVPIALDVAALESAGISPQTKVNVRARTETIESLLTKALAAQGLAWEVREGQLVVVPAK